MDIIYNNGIYYLGYEEKWKTIKYDNVYPNKYEVSNIGRFRKKKSHKLLFGNNPANEKGYCRIALKTSDNKIKKFSCHRIVLDTFGYLDKNAEVNHKNGNKRDCSIWNLENSNRLENAHHASINDLYRSCEDHYRSIFTNNEVDEICKHLSKGESISHIIKTMHLENRGDIYSNINKIINGKSWKKISSKYKFDYKKYHYKTYAYDDIYKMCECIFTKKMKNSEIVKLFPQYDDKKIKVLLKSLRAHKVHKKVINEYMSSTTIESIG